MKTHPKDSVPSRQLIEPDLFPSAVIPIAGRPARIIAAHHAKIHGERSAGRGKQRPDEGQEGAHQDPHDGAEPGSRDCRRPRQFRAVHRAYEPFIGAAGHFISTASRSGGKRRGAAGGGASSLPSAKRTTKQSAA